MAKHKKIEVPWTDVINSTAWYTAYRDIVDGDLKRYVFVPYELNGISMSTAVISSHQIGTMHTAIGDWKGYHILIKVGKDAGQEIEQPCIELVPMR